VVLDKEAIFVMMTVAAVVPHWNRRDLLQTLIASLRAQTRPWDEIIVADNGSTDDSATLAESLGARVVRLGRNLGFAAAVNRGIEAAQSDCIAILNNDITLAPDWLQTLLDALEREGASFATGKIVRAGDPSIIDGTFDEISRGACACRCGAGQPDGPVWNRPRRIRFAPMTAALFRRELFERVGKLDESFESYLEDVDFGIRCATFGVDGVYLPAAVAHHRGSATLGAWNSDTVRLIARNQILLAAKHFRGQPRWPVVAGQLLWGALAVRHGTGVAYLRGKISGWRCRSRAEQSGTNRDRLRTIFEASERDIFEIGRQTGFDWYWRTYFWLLRR
jgi:GT2 family glycosyltransferase